MKFVFIYQDIRTNNEDFVLTPFLFLVRVSEEKVRIYGIGIAWFWYSFAINIGFNLPKHYPRFKKFT